MSKPHSDNALPEGFVLREWRLDQVLDAGHRAIVYYGRDIYFDEPVAIKEHFPRAIAERGDDGTVVPTGAEEAFSAGLKEFVESAKRLWNLSTPARCPNLVIVRSLFEVQGTAYLVMDFEPGVPLSTFLERDVKWDEASLDRVFRPIADGLELAHGAGVVHRDIAPSNILVDEDGRPVLIGFGSGTVEEADAVAPRRAPYAAIEQYDPNFEQGPWTDIYALGVVLYECITGTRPPDAAERLHAGVGPALTDSEWPGFSPRFLAAVDAAMGIGSSDRPQSISQWLALFDGGEQGIGQLEPGEAPLPEEEGTVAPTKARSGGKKATSGKAKKQALPPLSAEEAVGDAAPEPPAKADAEPKPGRRRKIVVEAKPETPAPAASKRPPRAAKGPVAAKKQEFSPALIGIAALALIGLGVGGWYVVTGQGARPDPELVGSAEDEPLAELGSTADVAAVPTEPPVDLDAAGGVTRAMQALVTDARKAGASASALAKLTAAAQQLAGMTASPDAEAAPVAIKGAAEFAAALAGEADARARRLARDIPWVDPRRTNAAAKESVERQRLARDIRAALSGVHAAASAATAATDPAASLTAARQAMAWTNTLNAAIARAYRSGTKAQPRGATSEAAAPAAAAPPVTEIPNTRSAAPPPPAVAAAVGRPEKLFPAKYENFNSVVRSARDTANEVVKLDRGSKPRDDASQAEKDAYRTRHTNAQAARDYLNYLDSLVKSMRTNRTEGEVDLNVANAGRTRDYVRQLLEVSRANRAK